MVFLTTKKILVLNNAFDPSLICSQQTNFKNIKHIVVDRDPRFIYLDQVKNGAFRRLDDKSVLNFIESFKFTRRQCTRLKGNKILSIKFENLVLEYSNEIDRLANFLN